MNFNSNHKQESRNKSILVIILNVNELNFPIKRQRLSHQIKNKPSYGVLAVLTVASCCVVMSRNQPRKHFTYSQSLSPMARKVVQDKIYEKQGPEWVRLLAELARFPRLCWLMWCASGMRMFLPNFAFALLLF